MDLIPLTLDSNPKRGITILRLCLRYRQVKIVCIGIYSAFFYRDHTTKKTHNLMACKYFFYECLFLNVVCNVYACDLNC